MGEHCMKMLHRLTLVLFVLFSLLVSISLAQSDDTVIIAQGVDAFTMDPAKHTVLPTAAILNHIYDPLVIRNAQGEMTPGLAVSWEQIEPTAWEFKLREGVSFHNGEPFNAEAVKFSLERALDPATESPYRSRISMITGVEVVDDYTVIIRTETPDPVLLQRLNQASFSSLILPPEYVAEHGGNVPDDAPVGTGPYKFVEWLRDERVELEANEDYWGGAPEIEHLIWRPIPEDSARIAALKNGEVDIVVNVPPERAPELESGDTKVSVVNSDFLYFVVFNTLDVPEFQDPKVREALNYAVDVDAILENIMLGYGDRIAVTMTKNGFAYPSQLAPREYDPEKAKQMLAEAGYPDGFGPIEFMSRNGRYLKDAEIVETIAGYLREVGVDVNVNFVEPGVWGDLAASHGRGDMNFPGWSGLDPDLVWYPILHTGEIQSYFSNPELDALLEAGRSTTDQDERLKIYTEAGQLIYDLSPHIPLFQPPLIYASDANLEWSPSGDDIINLRGASFSE